MKLFKVWARSPRTFATLAEAKAYAESYFRRRGVIVAITETQARKESTQ